MGEVRGFTIVELLIVIVVIGILAAITVVAYGGIQNRANDSAVRSDLRSIGQKIEEYKILNSRLPTVLQLKASGAAATHSAYGHHYIDANNLLFCHIAGTDGDYGLVAASKSGQVLVYKNGSVTKGAGPLVSWTTTCKNNGLPEAGNWLFFSGTWHI